MSDTSYFESIKAGIAHVYGHSQYDRPYDNSHPALMIEEGRGSREGCLYGLESFHAARCIHAWFANQDLETFKQEAYVASKLRYIRCKDFGWEFPHEQEYFNILMSDYAPLRDFWSSFPIRNATTLNRLNDPNDHLFRHYQMSLALRGDWQLLGQRAQEQLDAQPPKLKRFMADQRFYLALAQGDKDGMTKALVELTSPKMAKTRNDQLEFAFTKFFIGTHAVMYAKIAWRWGHKLETDTHFIPREWLPVQALEKYEDPYPFMRAYQSYER